MTAWTFIDGEWREGNPLVAGPMTHALWLASCVFDGARAFEGVAPDLERHCQRLVASAESFALKVLHPADEIEAIARQGIARFDASAQLYIRPMLWADAGFVDVDPDSTRFCLCVYDAPLPPADGVRVIRSSFRRPSFEFAPTDAKAACHYPNSARALREAKSRGFDNAIMLDGAERISELATANIFIARDGEVATPAPNGTFLNGITRQRIIALLKDEGVTVAERDLTFDDVLSADEVFTTGNWAKVQPIIQVEDVSYQPGPMAALARKLYWDFAHDKG